MGQEHTQVMMGGKTAENHSLGRKKRSQEAWSCAQDRGKAFLLMCTLLVQDGMEECS